MQLFRSRQLSKSERSLGLPDLRSSCVTATLVSFQTHFKGKISLLVFLSFSQLYCGYLGWMLRFRPEVWRGKVIELKEAKISCRMCAFVWERLLWKVIFFLSREPRTCCRQGAETGGCGNRGQWGQSFGLILGWVSSPGREVIRGEVNSAQVGKQRERKTQLLEKLQQFLSWIKTNCYMFNICV